MGRILFILLAAAVFAATAARAQDTEQEQRDVGFIQGFLEENLSGAGRVVRIEGFDGALSSRATIETLTIADAQGVWLTLRGAVLDWNRSALLRGRVEVTELAAQSLEVTRRPDPGEAAAPAPEAQPLALPDLPVSINIERLNLARVALGPDILGQEAVLRATGSAALNGGQGTVQLAVERTDGREGRFAIAGTLNEDAGTAALNIELTEGEGGIAADLLDLPGEPAIGLRITGEGPLNDFVTRVELATDGQTRLSGTVETITREVEGADTPPVRRFEANLGGDLRPLLQEQYRAFLGEDLRLRAAGEALPAGGVLLERFTLSSDALLLAGSATTAPNGWPRQVTVTGRIAPKATGSVLLALPGAETSVTGANLKLRYDADEGDAWTLDMNVAGLSREDFAVSRTQLSGRGSLSPSDTAINGTLTVEAEGLELKDPALSKAVGSSLEGGFDFAFAQGQPLTFTGLSLIGDGFGVTGDANVAGLEGQLDLRIGGSVRLQAEDLSRYADIAGTALGGGANVAISGTFLPVSGGFDVVIDGTAQDLRTGIAQLDPQLDGETAVKLVAARGPEGIELTTLTIDGTRIDLSARGDLSSETGDLVYDVAVADVGRSVAGLTGPATVKGSATRRGTRWSVDATGTGPGNTSAKVTAGVTQTDDGFGPLSGEIEASIGALSAFSTLADRSLGGALKLSAKGSGDLRDQSFDLQATAEGQQLRSGDPTVDQLLVGRSTLTLDAARDGAGVLTVRTFDLTTPTATAELRGTHSDANTALTYDLTIANIGLFVSRLNGPATARGTAQSSGGPIAVDTAITGPGGIDATIAGTVARDGGSGNLSIVGVTPLALANLYIAPTLVDGIARLDLRLDGPLQPASLSGSVTVRGARVTSPALRNSLTDVSADISLGGGVARVDATANVASGGRLVLTGQTGLAAPFRADLTAQVAGLRITDPGLYETTADGRIVVSGPLTGGASITGRLDLGEVELRIPSGVNSLDGALPGLVHRNEPADVRRTRAFAGLIGGDSGAGASGRSGGPAFALNLLISAPSRIFVRGRGLDAELGGQLRLTGTTNNVIPQGRFDLIRGRLDLLGKRITLTEASAQLQGGFVPFIRAEAETRNNDVLITIRLEGPADAPELTLTSTPDLPDDEILAQLLFDKDLTSLSPLQALQLANAIRTLAGKSGEGIVGKLREGFGFDDLDFATGEDGAAGVRIGKYLTDNVYTDVTVDTEGNSEVNLNLTITPSLTARGSVDSTGETGIGIYFERDY